jgi:two-component system alkaline phosphatase synthesis response regulator PhoP
MPAISQDHDKAKILVVEDEPDIRELVVITLSFNGFEVASAADGEEALAMAGADSFDLIILDVRMPRMTGFEACRHLRQRENTRETPIIFLSAKGQESEVKAGLEAGADEYIIKPFAPNELARRVRAALDAHGT